ncbi:MAG: hypothetical protein C5B50_08295 [Verrucomicrobia bacterium]|nr:MAG: hypothetical protein C5B50_08295 [Verrucomicrobiota bacterium]
MVGSVAPQPRSLAIQSRLLWAAIVVLGGCGAAGIGASLAAAPGAGPHREFIIGFVLVGWAFGLTQITKSKHSVQGRPVTLPSLKRLGLTGGWRFSLLAVLSGLALVLLILWCGMRQFGGTDHGFAVDTGWRLVQGQRPYLDFPCTVPPAFFLGAGYAFELFGMSWRALILFTSLVSVANFLWSVWLCVRLFGDRIVSLLLALAVQCLTLVLASGWLYNPITSAGACVFLLSAALLWSRPGDIGARISYVISLVLLALLKPNMAGVLIALISLRYFCSRQHRLLAVLLSGAGFALFLLFLSLNHLSFLDLLKSYISVASHASSVTKNAVGSYPNMTWPDLSLYLLLYLPPVIGILLLAKSGLRQGLRGFFAQSWIGICGIVGSINPLMTNGECKLVDLVPALVGAVLLARPLFHEPLNGLDGGGREMASSPRSSSPDEEREKQPALAGQCVFKGARARSKKLRAFEGRHDAGSSHANAERLPSKGGTPVRGPIGRTKSLAALPAAGDRRSWVIGLLLAAIFAGTGMALSRDRVRMIGYGAFFEYELQPPLAGGFFKGLRTGPNFRETLAQMSQLLAKAPDTSVFFGPRLEWAYAAFRRPSPLNQPICWDPGVMFATTEGGDLVDSLLKKRYDLIIFRRDDSGTADFSFWAFNMLQAVAADYIADLHHTHLLLGVRGKLTGALLSQGGAKYAISELRAILTRDPDLPGVLADLALILSVHPQVEIRDGAQAVRLAKRACELTHYKEATIVGTLGVAYAEVGRFEDAVANGEKALELAQAARQKEQVALYEEQVRFFKARVPYRDTSMR